MKCSLMFFLIFILIINYRSRKLSSVIESKIKDNFYVIVSRNSDKCFDVYGANTGNNERIIQYDCHAGFNQQFRMEEQKDGSVVFYARHTGKALTVLNASHSPTRIVQYDYLKKKNQQFRIVPTEDIGYFHIKPEDTPGFCFDIAGNSTGNIAEVTQYNCHSGYNQQFSFNLANLV